LSGFGDHAVKVAFEDSASQVRNRLVFRTEEPTTEVVEEGNHWSFNGGSSAAHRHLIPIFSIPTARPPDRLSYPSTPPPHW
jgi:hypothetical protein